MSFWEAIIRVLGAILALALVLFLAWLVLRLLNRAMPGLQGTSAGRGRFVQVLERIPYGKGTTLLLLRVQNTVMLVACTEHAVEKLWEIEDADGSFQPPAPGEMPSFADSLKSAAGRMGLGKRHDGEDKP